MTRIWPRIKTVSWSQIRNCLDCDYRVVLKFWFQYMISLLCFVLVDIIFLSVFSALSDGVSILFTRINFCFYIHPRGHVQRERERERERESINFIFIFCWKINDSLSMDFQNIYTQMARLQQWWYSVDNVKGSLQDWLSLISTVF